MAMICGVHRPELSFQPHNWKNDWSDRIRAQWETQKEDLGSTNAMEAIHSFKTDEQQTSPNILCVAAPMGIALQTDGSYYFTPGFGVSVVADRPTSTGCVTLRSKNPFDDPSSRTTI